MNSTRILKVRNQVKSRLVSGNKSFAKVAKKIVGFLGRNTQDRYDALMINCSDSRMRVVLPFAEDAPRIMEISSAGNLAGTGDRAYYSLMLKAMNSLKTGQSVYPAPQVIFVGHTHCGFVGALRTRIADPTALDGEIQNIQALVSSQAGRYPRELAEMGSPESDQKSTVFQLELAKEVFSSIFPSLGFTALFFDWNTEPVGLDTLNKIGRNKHPSPSVFRALKDSFNDATFCTNEDFGILSLSTQTAHTVILSDPTRLPINPSTIFAAGLNEIFSVSILVNAVGNPEMDKIMVGSADYALSHVKGLNGEQGTKHVLALDTDPEVAKDIARVFLSRTNVEGVIATPAVFDNDLGGVVFLE